MQTDNVATDGRGNFQWERQFSRDRDRGSNDEAEATQGEAAENQAEARPRQGSQKIIKLNS